MLMPASIAASVSAAVASLWPPEGTMPARLISRMKSMTPGTSGAQVIRWMAGARSR